MATHPIQHQRTEGREASNHRVRRTIRRALEAGRAGATAIVGSVSAHLTGSATRSLAIVPLRLPAGTTPLRRPESGGCSLLWVASPSAARSRQG